MDDEMPRLLRTDAHTTLSPEAAEIRRRHRAKQLHRVVPGAYLAASDWEAMFAREQHVMSIRALWPTMAGRPVVARVSAACLYGWADVDSLPDRVHVIDSHAASTQTRRHVVRHGEHLEPDEVWSVNGILLTSPVRTAVDVARTLPFAGAVAALDCALRRPDVTKDKLLAMLQAHAGERGVAMARRAIDFADARSGSAAESFARVVLFEIRAPTPQLQREFTLANKELAGVVDFFFGDQGVVLEIDGLGKYTDRRYLRGSTPGDAYISEKEREQRLYSCPEVKRIVRCGWKVLRAPEQFRQMLSTAGVPVRW